jgi:hypothetical protein
LVNTPTSHAHQREQSFFQDFLLQALVHNAHKHRILCVGELLTQE